MTALGPTIAALAALAGVAMSQWQARVAQREQREHDLRMQTLAWERGEHERNTERRLSTYSDFLEACDILASRVQSKQPHLEASEAFFAKYHRLKLIASPEISRVADHIQKHVKHLISGKPRSREDKLNFLKAKGWFAQLARAELGGKGPNLFQTGTAVPGAMPSTAATESLVSGLD